MYQTKTLADSDIAHFLDLAFEQTNFERSGQDRSYLALLRQTLHHLKGARAITHEELDAMEQVTSMFETQTLRSVVKKTSGVPHAIVVWDDRRAHRFFVFNSGYGIQYHASVGERHLPFFGIRYDEKWRADVERIADAEFIDELYAGLRFMVEVGGVEPLLSMSERRPTPNSFMKQQRSGTCFFKSYVAATRAALCSLHGVSHSSYKIIRTTMKIVHIKNITAEVLDADRQFTNVDAYLIDLIASAAMRHACKRSEPASEELRAASQSLREALWEHSHRISPPRPNSFPTLQGDADAAFAKMLGYVPGGDEEQPEVVVGLVRDRAVLEILSGLRDGSLKPVDALNLLHDDVTTIPLMAGEEAPGRMLACGQILREACAAWTEEAVRDSEMTSVAARDLMAVLEGIFSPRAYSVPADVARAAVPLPMSMYGLLPPTTDRPVVHAEMQSPFRSAFVSAMRGSERDARVVVAAIAEIVGAITNINADVSRAIDDPDELSRARMEEQPARFVTRIDEPHESGSYMSKIAFEELQNYMAGVAASCDFATEDGVRKSVSFVVDRLCTFVSDTSVCDGETWPYPVTVWKTWYKLCCFHARTFLAAAPDADVSQDVPFELIERCCPPEIRSEKQMRMFMLVAACCDPSVHRWTDEAKARVRETFASAKQWLLRSKLFFDRARPTYHNSVCSAMTLIAFQMAMSEDVCFFACLGSTTVNASDYAHTKFPTTPVLDVNAMAICDLAISDAFIGFCSEQPPVTLTSPSPELEDIVVTPAALTSSFNAQRVSPDALPFVRGLRAETSRRHIPAIVAMSTGVRTLGRNRYVMEYDEFNMLDFYKPEFSAVGTWVETQIRGCLDTDLRASCELDFSQETDVVATCRGDFSPLHDVYMPIPLVHYVLMRGIKQGRQVADCMTRCRKMEDGSFQIETTWSGDDSPVARRQVGDEIIHLRDGGLDLKLTPLEDDMSLPILSALYPASFMYYSHGEGHEGVFVAVVTALGDNLLRIADGQYLCGSMTVSPHSDESDPVVRMLQTSMPLHAVDAEGYIYTSAPTYENVLVLDSNNMQRVNPAARVMLSPEQESTLTRVGKVVSLPEGGTSVRFFSGVSPLKTPALMARMQWTRDVVEMAYATDPDIRGTMIETDAALMRETTAAAHPLASHATFQQNYEFPRLEEVALEIQAVLFGGGRDIPEPSVEAVMQLTKDLVFSVNVDGFSVETAIQILMRRKSPWRPPRIEVGQGSADAPEVDRSRLKASGLRWECWDRAIDNTIQSGAMARHLIPPGIREGAGSDAEFVLRMFEWKNSWWLRDGSVGEDQKKLIMDLYESANSQTSCIRRVIMGFGKTSVVIPALLTLLVRDESAKSVVFTTTPHMMEQSLTRIRDGCAGWLGFEMRHVSEAEGTLERGCVYFATPRELHALPEGVLSGACVVMDEADSLLDPIRSDIFRPVGSRVPAIMASERHALVQVALLEFAEAHTADISHSPAFRFMGEKVNVDYVRRVDALMSDVSCPVLRTVGRRLCMEVVPRVSRMRYNVDFGLPGDDSFVRMEATFADIPYLDNHAHIRNLIPAWLLPMRPYFIQGCIGVVPYQGKNNPSSSVFSDFDVRAALNAMAYILCAPPSEKACVAVLLQDILKLCNAPEVVLVVDGAEEDRLRMARGVSSCEALRTSPEFRLQMFRVASANMYEVDATVRKSTALDLFGPFSPPAVRIGLTGTVAPDFLPGSEGDVRGAGWDGFERRCMFRESMRAGLGEDDRVLNTLRGCKPLPFRGTALDQVLRAWEEAGGTKFVALIDVGSFFTNVPNGAVVEALVKAGLWRSGMYFDDDTGKLCRVLEDLTVVAVPRVEAIPRAERRVFFDTNHTTGVDITLPADGAAILTLSDRNSVRDFAQGAYRMREVEEGQRVFTASPCAGRALESLRAQDVSLTRQQRAAFVLNAAVHHMKHASSSAPLPSLPECIMDATRGWQQWPVEHDLQTADLDVVPNTLVVPCDPASSIPGELLFTATRAQRRGDAQVLDMVCANISAFAGDAGMTAEREVEMEVENERERERTIGDEAMDTNVILRGLYERYYTLALSPEIVRPAHTSQNASCEPTSVRILGFAGDVGALSPEISLCKTGPNVSSAVASFGTSREARVAERYMARMPVAWKDLLTLSSIRGNWLIAESMGATAERYFRSSPMLFIASIGRLSDFCRTLRSLLSDGVPSAVRLLSHISSSGMMLEESCAAYDIVTELTLSSSAGISWDETVCRALYELDGALPFDPKLEAMDIVLRETTAGRAVAAWLLSRWNDAKIDAGQGGLAIHPLDMARMLMLFVLLPVLNETFRDLTVIHASMALKKAITDADRIGLKQQ